MSQHDMNIANADGASFRADLNSALQAMVENSSGASIPDQPFIYQWWADTTTGYMKIRNAANSAWIIVFQLSTGGMIQGADIVATAALPVLVDGNFNDVTGTTGITSINALGIGTIKWLQFDAVVTITHDGTNLILPDAANITTVAGQILCFYEYASGDWRLISNSLPTLIGQIEVTDVTVTGSAAATPDANTLTKDHMIGAKCVFDGTGTPAYTEEINFSGSITDNAVGGYTLTIDRDFAGSNYVAIGSSRVADPLVVGFHDAAAGSIQIELITAGGSNLDSPRIYVVLIGAQ